MSKFLIVQNVENDGKTGAILCVIMQKAQKLIGKLPKDDNKMNKKVMYTSAKFVAF